MRCENMSSIRVVDVKLRKPKKAKSAAKKKRYKNREKKER